MAEGITENNCNPLPGFSNLLGQNIDNTILSLGLRSSHHHLVSHFQGHTLINPITLRAKKNHHPGSGIFNLHLEVLPIDATLN
jgi:hypothetical protein